MITRLIKQFEGLRLEAYRCPAGVWTIGYGHTSGVHQGQMITEAEAERLLREDLEPVIRALPGGLSEPRRAALASLCFNIGVSAFMASTIRRLVCADPEDPRIGAEFLRWKYSRGRELPGLLARRRAEAALYTAQEF